jgi:hypothetical protein
MEQTVPQILREINENLIKYQLPAGALLAYEVNLVIYKGVATPLEDFLAGNFHVPNVSIYIF